MSEWVHHCGRSPELPPSSFLRGPTAPSLSVHDKRTAALLARVSNARWRVTESTLLGRGAKIRSLCLLCQQGREVCVAPDIYR